MNVPGERKVEIRYAGAMGKGVFAIVPIRQGEILGEALGELVPRDEPLGTVFGFTFRTVGIDASQYGNWPVCIFLILLLRTR